MEDKHKGRKGRNESRDSSLLSATFKVRTTNISRLLRLLHKTIEISQDLMICELSDTTVNEQKIVNVVKRFEELFSNEAYYMDSPNLVIIATNQLELEVDVDFTGVFPFAELLEIHKAVYDKVILMKSSSVNEQRLFNAYHNYLNME